MKVVLLAGGLGTRISEESHLRPKPMIEIGKYPILVHIMRIYSHFGFKDFVICAGYKQQIIKEYFANFSIYTDDCCFDFLNNKVDTYNTPKFDWKVIVADTGQKTMTGGRIKRVKNYIGNETFLLTYGDAVGDIDINDVIKSHRESGKLATICVYNFGQTKGIVEIDSSGIVKQFREKANNDGDLINIGYMVLEPEVLDFISGDECVFEKDVLEKLASIGQLNA